MQLNSKLDSIQEKLENCLRNLRGERPPEPENPNKGVPLLGGVQGELNVLAGRADDCWNKVSEINDIIAGDLAPPVDGGIATGLARGRY